MEPVSGRRALESLQPADWLPPRGYANGMAAEGRLVFVAGQVGWDPRTGRFESDDFVEQSHQALRNVASVLREAGAEPRHVTRLTWYVTDRDAYLSAQRGLGAAFRDLFGGHFPAMTLVMVAGLLEPRALVEIEATAVVPR